MPYLLIEHKYKLYSFINNQLIKLLIIILFGLSTKVVAQIDTTMFKTGTYNFTRIELDSSIAKKTFYLEQALKSWPSDAIELNVDLRLCHLVNLNHDNLPDLVYTGLDSSVSDHGFTIFFINKVDSFQINSVKGLITSFVQDSSIGLIVIKTFENACCNSPYQSFFEYINNSCPDTFTLKKTYKTPRPNITSSFVLPTSFLPTNVVKYQEIKLLYLNPKGEKGLHGENFNFGIHKKATKILAEEGDFQFIEIKEPENVFWYGWIR